MATDHVLHRGDLIGHFEGKTIAGEPLPYARIWQHRNLVLFVVSPTLRLRGAPYLESLEGRLSRLQPDDTSIAVSERSLDGLPLNTLAIADRWGEIAHVESVAADPAAWPPIEDVVEWIEYLGMKCPECPP